MINKKTILKNFAIILFIILLGILSRIIKFNNVILDKYLGDLLYALMFYYIFKLFLANHWHRVGLTFSLMIIFEVLQLIGISQILRSYQFLPYNILAILIGSQFSFLDILAYTIGLIIVSFIELRTKD